MAALKTILNQAAGLLAITTNVQPAQPGYPSPTTPNPYSVTALGIALPDHSLDLFFATSAITYP